MPDEDSPKQQTGMTRVSGTRRWAGALLLGANLPVLGAAIAGQSILSSSRRPARIAREPVELHRKGDFMHPAGFLMPEKAGPFEREKVIEYDPLGCDVSAGYNALVWAAGTPLPILGYEEPWGGVPEDVPLRSYLALYRWNGWWVKWQATTPAAVSPERMRAIVDLTERLLPPEVEPAAPGQPSESDPAAERLALRSDGESRRDGDAVARSDVSAPLVLHQIRPAIPATEQEEEAKWLSRCVPTAS